MKQIQNPKENTNNITEIPTAHIYKYVGYADEKECPNCGEDFPINSAWENIITKEIISACAECASPIMIRKAD